MKRKNTHRQNNVYIPKLTTREDTVVRKIAMRTYRSIGCTDYARVDLRVDKQKIPWVLEVNTLPGIFPKFSPMAKMADVMGKGVEYLSMQILEEAMVRYDL